MDLPGCRFWGALQDFERFAFSMQGIELLRILNQGDVPIWSVSRDWRQKLDRQIDCEYGKDLFAKMFVIKYSINKHAEKPFEPIKSVCVCDLCLYAVISASDKFNIHATVCANWSLNNHWTYLFVVLVHLITSLDAANNRQRSLNYKCSGHQTQCKLTVW